MSKQIGFASFCFSNYFIINCFHINTISLLTSRYFLSQVDMVDKCFSSSLDIGHEICPCNRRNVVSMEERNNLIQLFHVEFRTKLFIKKQQEHPSVSHCVIISYLHAPDPKVKMEVCAFQITCKLLYFTFEDYRRN